MVASGSQIKDYTAATTPESDWYFVAQDPNEATAADATKSILISDLINMAGHKNILINGGFTVNQRVYVSAATLAATVYGHDRWKGGSGGGDYSFTQLNSPTTITIAANKTLIQVVENKNVIGGTYTLSWTGTCQARYAVDSATPSGSYAASPITITGQTAGTTMSVEFGNGASAGTLSNVQLESGTTATDFEHLPYDVQLARCHRYYQKTYDYGTAVGASTTVSLVGSSGNAASTTTGYLSFIYWFRDMRATPTVVTYDSVGASGKINRLRVT